MNKIPCENCICLPTCVYRIREIYSGKRGYYNIIEVCLLCTLAQEYLNIKIVDHRFLFSEKNYNIFRDFFRIKNK